MIDAHFDPTRSRGAAISGVYQFDTGQRLRLLGLPSKEELGNTGDLVGGIEEPSVSVHFCYEGDTEVTDTAAFQPEGEPEAWYVDVPDDYLMRSEPVHLYVYVYYGDVEIEVTDEETGETRTDTVARASTMYEGVFTPIARPALRGTVTVEIQNAWEALQSKIDDAQALAQAAAENAEKGRQAAQAVVDVVLRRAGEADDAAKEVKAAQDQMTEVGDEFKYAQVTVESLPPETKYATAKLIDEGNVRRFLLGIPRGADGADGARGEKGPADVSIIFDAMTDSLTITMADWEG